jgi:hypothetical protein
MSATRNPDIASVRLYLRRDILRRLADYGEPLGMSLSRAANTALEVGLATVSYQANQNSANGVMRPANEPDAS